MSESAVVAVCEECWREAREEKEAMHREYMAQLKSDDPVAALHRQVRNTRVGVALLFVWWIGGVALRYRFASVGNFILYASPSLMWLLYLRETDARKRALNLLEASEAQVMLMRLGKGGG